VSTTALAAISPAATEPIDLRLAELRRMVLNSVVSEHSKRNYAKALDDLFLFAASRPLTRALLMEWRAAMNKLSPSTVNVRLSAMRKLVSEARRNGMLGAEEAANLTEVPNIPEKGTRLGNWLTREQAKELLAVPTVPPSRANATTPSWRSWSAAPCAGRSSPNSPSRRSRCARAAG